MSLRSSPSHNKHNGVTNRTLVTIWSGSEQMINDSVYLPLCPHRGNQ